MEAAAPTTVCPKATGICHEFFANDNSNRQNVNYVNEFAPAQNWVVNVVSGGTGVNSPRSLGLIANAKGAQGRALIVSVDKGFMELDPDNKGAKLGELLRWSNVTGVIRLPDGNTAVAAGASILVVNTMSGATISTMPLQGSADLRAISRNPVNGNYLYTRTVGADAFAYEMSPTGGALASVKMPAGGKGYLAVPREGGGFFATTGELGSVITVDASRAIVSTMEGKKSTLGTAVDFFSGFTVLPNGNFVVANWLGHIGGAVGNVPQVIEFTPAGGVVWSYGTQTWATQVTNVLVVR